MVNRFLEVMALALLVVLTIGTTFQVLNYQLLREMQEQMKDQARRPVAAGAPPVQSAPPAARAPARVPKSTAPPAGSATLDERPEQDPVEPPPPARKPVEPPPPTRPSRPEPPQTPPEPEPDLAPKPEPTPETENPDEPEPNPEPDPAPEQDAATRVWEEHREDVEEIIRQLYDARFAQVFDRFAPDLADGLPLDALTQTMKKAVADWGQLRAVRPGKLAAHLSTADSMTFHVPVRTDKDKTLMFSVSLTKDRKISGLLFKPVAE